MQKYHASYWELLIYCLSEMSCERACYKRGCDCCTIYIAPRSWYGAWVGTLQFHPCICNADFTCRSKIFLALFFSGGRSERLMRTRELNAFTSSPKRNKYRRKQTDIRKLQYSFGIRERFGADIINDIAIMSVFPHSTTLRKLGHI